MSNRLTGFPSPSIKKDYFNNTYPLDGLHYVIDPKGTAYVATREQMELLRSQQLILSGNPSKPFVRPKRVR